jgi:hypothetical protein
MRHNIANPCNSITTPVITRRPVLYIYVLFYDVWHIATTYM